MSSKKDSTKKSKEVKRRPGVYTREDIYDLLHTTIPKGLKQIGKALGVKQTRRMAMITDEMVLLYQRCIQLSEEGAIRHVDYQGYVLVERIPRPQSGSPATS